PVAALRALIPEPLEVDTWEGRAYVGLVPFAMRRIKPSWLPRAMAFDFLETNLRTYVHLAGQRPGVWFFSLEASSWLAVQAARIGWSLPYHYARMSMTRDDGQLESVSERRRGQASARLRWSPRYVSTKMRRQG
ncbi:MAG: DUF2071 domain-containing protein, partial [Nannocystaceae bacterium]